MKEQSATPKYGAGRRSKYRHGASATNVQAITNAAVSHSDEMRSRMVKYSVTMGIRMVCLAAIFVFDGWFKLIPVIGAVVLPWVAVVLANGGADVVHQETVELLDEAPMYAVSGGEAGTGDGAEPGDVLAGEIVPDDTDESDGVEDKAAGNEPAGAAADADHGAADGGPHASSEEASQEDRHHEHL